MSTPEPISSGPVSSVVVHAGTTVGSYRLERRLGAGGMGEVWLGRHVVSNGLGAVKLLGPKVSQRADAVTLFAREKSALLRLSHPHIVPVFEVGERHITMAYIDGASLGRKLRAGIAPEDVFRMGRQIASALAHAHARGVLHLDVKPSNVLTDTAGNAYLADFGAASLVEEAPDPHVLGTPAYIAPERANGEAPRPAADQFALGRTLAAALLGTERLPAWGREVDALPASIPVAARAVLARALAVDPAARYANLVAFEEALAACDLEGVIPNVGALEPVRAPEPYAWAARPSATTVMAPEIARADYDVSALERDAALPAASLRAFQAATGLRTTGFSLYGHTRSLGAAPGPSWLARARHLVVLAPGYAMARECWSELAVALVRDNPDTVVASVDHSGFGDSAFAASPPALEHMTFTAITGAILAFTELCALASLPTVFLGHSLAATGFFLVPDEAFGPHRARILLTPMFSRLTERAPPQRFRKLLARVLASIFRIRSLYLAFFRARARSNESLAELTLERQRAMIAQAVQLPPATHMRMALALASAVPTRLEPLRRTYFVLGVNDPEATPAVCQRACQLLGIRPERFRWLASGSHCPHLESLANPEGTLRNRHELVLLVDEALDEVNPSRQTSTEFAETELSALERPAEDATPTRSRDDLPTRTA